MSLDDNDYHISYLLISLQCVNKLTTRIAVSIHNGSYDSIYHLQACCTNRKDQTGVIVLTYPSKPIGLIS